MKLNERYYKSITYEENSLWEALKEQEKVVINGEISSLIKKSLYSNYPVAVRHFLSFFSKVPEHWLFFLKTITIK